MSITVYTSIGWAVEKQTISANGNLTNPQLTSAVSTDPNTVRLTFDRKLMLEYRIWGVYRAQTLDLTSFNIVKISDSTPLEVVRTVWIDDTHIDLLTANQDSANYRVTAVAGGVMDYWGNLITTQTADFLGQQKTDYTSPDVMRSFTSGVPGMQENFATDFYPDLEPPYWQNLSPAPLTDNVAPDATVTLEIVDDYTGVKASSVIIQFNGTDVWKLDAAQPGYTVSKTTITNGYRYSVTGHPVFGSNININVHVYADDLAVITNTLDDTYYFTTVDFAPPSFDTLSPTGVDVAKNAVVHFSVKDLAGHGVNLATIQSTIGGVLAVQNGVPQGIWSGGTVTPNAFGGYDFDLPRSSGYYESFTSYGVYVEADDLEYPPNHNSVGWTFRIIDYYGALVHPVNPTSGQPGAPGDTSITIEITDLEGILPNTLQVHINRGLGFIVAYKQGDVPAFKPGYDGPGSTIAYIPGGYRITIDPTTDFTFGTTIYVAVSALDPKGNPERLG